MRREPSVGRSRCRVQRAVRGACNVGNEGRQGSDTHASPEKRQVSVVAAAADFCQSAPGPRQRASEGCRDRDETSPMLRLSIEFIASSDLGDAFQTMSANLERVACITNPSRRSVEDSRHAPDALLDVPSRRGPIPGPSSQAPGRKRSPAGQEGLARGASCAAARPGPVHSLGGRGEGGGPELLGARGGQAELLGLAGALGVDGSGRRRSGRRRRVAPGSRGGRGRGRRAAVLRLPGQLRVGGRRVGGSPGGPVCSEDGLRETQTHVPG